MHCSGSPTFERHLRRMVRDPLVRSVMAADGVDEADLLALLRHTACLLAASRGRFELSRNGNGYPSHGRGLGSPCSFETGPPRGKHDGRWLP
jgi:hypothetical protein